MNDFALPIFHRTRVAAGTGVGAGVRGGGVLLRKCDLGRDAELELKRLCR